MSVIELDAPPRHAPGAAPKVKRSMGRWMVTADMVGSATSPAAASPRTRPPRPGMSATDRSGAGASAAAARLHVGSEVGTLRRVVLHRPDLELGG